ncbi:hypothetical protein G5C60_09495 [Streptomyces sp. HC44]|uniref:Glycerol-3-phosphate dehydrogenase NAD-dependent C-terminal domain-containing protein n=2 Tax=Streptomyces scabichelini TaxID=2711217 RepID=A0A6G4V1W2_9ACTN|nr:hypothetical protein [Streptomyces scabichelini]
MFPLSRCFPEVGRRTPGAARCFLSEAAATHLGRGLSVEEATAAPRQITEGVKSAEAILALAHVRDVDMPITEVISALLHEKVTLNQAAAALMQRPIKGCDRDTRQRGNGMVLKP